MTQRTALRSTFALVATLLITTAAQAVVVPSGLFRAYLAPTGNDANPCTLPSPCRLLPAALAAVADGGEIWMLDSANYNTATVTIAKSVSILAVPGAVGSVVATGGPAISIATDFLTVALRNLVIVPLPASGATDGVSMTGASSLRIENSLIANLPGNGVDVFGTGKVKIANTIIRDNFAFAVNLANGPRAEISGTQMLGNWEGVSASGAAATTTIASVSDSVISGGYIGVYAATSDAGAVVSIFVTRSTIENLSYGLAVQSVVGSPLISVSSSMITNNNQSWYQLGAGSVIESLGNNHIRGNSTFTGVLTPVGLQ